MPVRLVSVQFDKSSLSFTQVGGEFAFGFFTTRRGAKKGTDGLGGGRAGQGRGGLVNNSRSQGSSGFERIRKGLDSIPSMYLLR